MPGISDPGSALIAAAHDAGVPVEVLPGPSAALGVALLSGFDLRRFAFEGFPPRGAAARRERFAEALRERNHDDLVRVAAAAARRHRGPRLRSRPTPGLRRSRVHQAPRAAALGHAAGSPLRARRSPCAARSRSRSRPMRSSGRSPRPRRPGPAIDALLASGQRVGEVAKLLAARGFGERRQLYARAAARKARREPSINQSQPMERAYYVTTPIYYISGEPHIGHAYTTIVADVLARTARTFGRRFFLTGTDEHGQKVANAAAAAGKTPQEWTDELVPRWKALFALYEIAIRRLHPHDGTAPHREGAARLRAACASAATSISASTRAGTASTTRRSGSNRSSSTGAVRRAGARCSGSRRTTGSSGCRPTATA